MKKFILSALADDSISSAIRSILKTCSANSAQQVILDMEGPASKVMRDLEKCFRPIGSKSHRIALGCESVMPVTRIDKVLDSIASLNRSPGR